MEDVDRGFLGRDGNLQVAVTGPRADLEVKAPGVNAGGLSEPKVGVGRPKYSVSTLSQTPGPGLRHPLLGLVHLKRCETLGLVQTEVRDPERGGAGVGPQQVLGPGLGSWGHRSRWGRGSVCLAPL